MTETIDSREPDEVTAESPPGSLRSFAFVASDLISRRREASIAFVAVALFVYFAVSTSAFMGVDNMRVVAQFTASVAILAIAEAMLLISGEIDLSLGHIYAMTPFLMHFGTEAGLPLSVAVVLALLGAGVVGLVNGVMTVATGVPSFITTLGMLFFLNGFTLTISDGFPKPAPEDGIADILGGARFSGFIWAVVFMMIVHVVLVSTRWGVYTVATGGNPVGAREAGIQVKRIKVGNFVLAAMLAGFTGISEAIRVTSIDPLSGGSNLMFFGVAAAVIGGTALAGGSGTVIGAFLGAIVLGVLRDGLTIKGISSFTFNMILGIAIIASMFLNAIANRLRIRMRNFA
jgi:simple sugar transport system permease protein